MRTRVTQIPGESNRHRIHGSGPGLRNHEANLIERKYPLARATSIYINREPGKPIDSKVKEFLLYILSEEGQQEVARAGDFLPLGKETLGSNGANLSS